MIVSKSQVNGDAGSAGFEHRSFLGDEAHKVAYGDLVGC